jgi:hypothetical protein
MMDTKLVRYVIIVGGIALGSDSSFVRFLNKVWPILLFAVDDRIRLKATKV